MLIFSPGGFADPLPPLASGWRLVIARALRLSACHTDSLASRVVSVLSKLLIINWSIVDYVTTLGLLGRLNVYRLALARLNLDWFTNVSWLGRWPENRLRGRA